jgi:hypothetical protein
MKNQEPLACAAGVSDPATSCRPAAEPCGQHGPSRPYASQGKEIARKAAANGGRRRIRTSEVRVILYDRFPQRQCRMGEGLA